MHKKGYILALDDFIHDSSWELFYKLIDIVKSDYLVSTLQEIHLSTAAVNKYPDIKLLAEKVETNEEFKDALKLGFEYFQGYFFSYRKL